MNWRVLKMSAAFFAAGVALLAADFSSVKTVYVMRMTGGLDQYLANHLAQDGAFQVVTDPQKADAVFTDRIGASFEQALSDLYATKKPQDGKQDDSDTSRPVSIPPSSRGKGSIFLVDRNSRVVLWSTYAPSKGTSSQGLNQLAAKIVSEIDKSRKGK